MENKNIYQSLQALRNDKRLKGLKKGGKNLFQNFEYYELDDFLPIATNLFAEYGICPVFRIETDASGFEYAYLTLIKDNEQIIFKVPTANPSGNNPIQQLGSKITYMRRYLYILALDLSEQDSVDNNIGNKVKEKENIKYATPGQIAIISANNKLITNELKELNIQNQNDLKEITSDKAKELENLINERKNETK